MKAIPRDVIKTAIREHLADIEQWKSNYNHPAYVLKYYNKLEALVELLEVWDTGSVGGFDYQQPYNTSLDIRAKWVLNKVTDNRTTRKFPKL